MNNKRRLFYKRKLDKLNRSLLLFDSDIPAVISDNTDSELTIESTSDDNIVDNALTAFQSLNSTPVLCSTISDVSDLDIELSHGVSFFNKNLRKKNKPEEDISTKLQKWALRWRISHRALTDLLSTLKSVTFSERNCVETIPLDSRTLLGTPRSTTLKILGPNEYYYHFGIKEGLLTILHKHNTNRLVDTIYLSINIDGVPISNSSGSCLYPILGKICNNDVPLMLTKNIFLIGVYHGYKKPSNVNGMVEDFVTEAIEVIENGIWIENHLIKIKINNFVFDAVAKAQFLIVKSHMGYSSCTKCMEKGEMGKRGIFFPFSLNFKKRTNEEFKMHLDEEYHNGDTLLATIPMVDIIKDVVLDYMHLICLGVMKKLLVNFWIHGKPPHKLPFKDISKLNDKISIICKCVPCEFVRKPRSFLEVKRFKATEFRLLLLYTGMVIFHDILPRNKYLHFLTLCIAIRILCSPNKNDYNYAARLLEHFVESYEILYGSEYISHNVHNLLHVVDDANRFGPLDNFSAFAFENYLQELKKMLRKAEKPLPQIIKRVKENELNFRKSEIINTVKFHFLKEYSSGVIIEGFGNPQYKEVLVDGEFKITTKAPNNCCLLKTGEVVIVENIATCFITKNVYIIGRKFLKLYDFFTKPIHSSVIKIYVPSDLSEKLEFWELTTVSCKLVFLPFDNQHVAIPIIHTKSYN